MTFDRIRDVLEGFNSCLGDTNLPIEFVGMQTSHRWVASDHRTYLDEDLGHSSVHSGCDYVAISGGTKTHSRWICRVGFRLTSPSRL